ncbi:MAG TPA: type II secretion system F family protein [Actinomycetales bacterium]|nr:type II secretion system F family protein [Actinomycetales bacterium]
MGRLMQQVLVLTVAVLALWLVGLRVYLRGAAERDALRERTALDVVELRANRPGARLDVRLRRTRVGRALRTRIDRAGLPWRVVDVAAALAALAVLVYLVLAPFVAPLAALIASGLAVRGALEYFSHKQKQRTEQFVSQLPEVARVLSNATSAGLALRSAIEMTAEDVDEPSRGELRFLAEQLSVGKSMDDALNDLGERLPSRELSLLTHTLIIQARSGGAIVTALRGISETLDARKDLRREIRTMLSGAVFTSYIVIVMGVGSLLLLNVIAPGVLDRMTRELLGQAALVTAVALYVLGFVMVRRTTRIEV